MIGNLELKLIQANDLPIETEKKQEDFYYGSNLH